MKKGFTLIELLIVIAIIAILALIAVPNFLEAQVRAKVSRCHADMRSLANAIEMYTVDWGRPIPGRTEVNTRGCHDPIFDDFHQGGASAKTMYCQAKLTTPIAYITQPPQDPFYVLPGNSTTDFVEHRPYHMYAFVCPAMLDKSDLDNRNTNAISAAAAGYTWILYTRGPSKLGAGTARRAIYQNPPKGDDATYDPSNGTLSKGWIIRTNKGGFKGRPGS